jgi:hypothetical protein
LIPPTRPATIRRDARATTGDAALAAKGRCARAGGFIEAAPAADAPQGAQVEHEHVISRSLADALLAARDPKRDRAQAVAPDDAECKKLR